MSTDSDITDCIVSDPNAVPAEKETTINFSNDGCKMRIFSANRSIMKDMTQHTDIQIDSLSCYHNERYETLSPTEHDGEDVVGIRATAPIGLLKLGSSPRSRDVPSQVVSNQQEVNFE